MLGGWRAAWQETTAQGGQLQYRTLGRTGLKVSEIGFGAWAIGGGWGSQSDHDSLAALNRALELGVNFIDTAAGYGEGRSECLIGQVLKSRPEQVWVATKTPPLPGHWPPSPYDRAEERYPEQYLRENVEARLRNLGTERIDILQLHTWTRAWNKNPTPLEVLKKLQAEGKIRFIGISTPEHDQNSLIDLMRQGYLDVVQVIYNIFEQEPACAGRKGCPWPDVDRYCPSYQRAEALNDLPHITPYDAPML